MRTNIVVDDDPRAQAMAAAGATTKRETVELGLRTLLRLRRQGEIRRLRGTPGRSGDLEAMRTDG